jgi:uncharacterized protein (DUF433 family)
MSPILDQAERLLAAMNRGEKAQLLQWVVRDLGDAYPGIESHADVLGGEPCVVRTRIPVWILEQARRQGIPESELLNDYPTLRPQDLESAWVYAQAHPEEIDRQILENETA